MQGWPDIRNYFSESNNGELMRIGWQLKSGNSHVVLGDGAHVGHDLEMISVPSAISFGLRTWKRRIPEVEVSRDEIHRRCKGWRVKT